MSMVRLVVRPLVDGILFALPLIFAHLLHHLTTTTMNVILYVQTGAGSYGCMAAMNDGAVSGNGHIVGVIHEMFLVDNGFFAGKEIDRDGGAHQAFNRSSNTAKGEEGGPIREILVAGGDDLQQRKKFLVDKADAILVLPGGPGTWDEVRQCTGSR